MVSASCIETGSSINVTKIETSVEAQGQPMSLYGNLIAMPHILCERAGVRFQLQGCSDIRIVAHTRCRIDHLFCIVFELVFPTSRILFEAIKCPAVMRTQVILPLDYCANDCHAVSVTKYECVTETLQVVRSSL